MSRATVKIRNMFFSNGKNYRHTIRCTLIAPVHIRIGFETVARSVKYENMSDRIQINEVFTISYSKKVACQEVQSLKTTVILGVFTLLQLQNS